MVPKQTRKGRVDLLMKEVSESPITLYTPSLEDLWFRQKMMADEETMAYNHAWGGTIPFPKEVWHGWYDFWIVKHENKRYYRYLKDGGGHFIGEVAYHYDSDQNLYMADVIVYAPYRKMGYGSIGLNLLCDTAKQNGIKQLYELRLKKWCKAISLLPSNLHYATSLQALKSLSITCKRWSIVSCVHDSL